MKINETITRPAFGRFPQEIMKCIKIKLNDVYGDIYCFDNGMELCQHDLTANLNLWNKRR